VRGSAGLGTEPLSSRVRPDVEAAPWVVEAIKTLEAENAALRAANESVAGMKRFDLDPSCKCNGDGGQCYAEMEMTSDGDYVLYADIKALEAENAALKSLTDRQVKRTGELTGQVDSLLRENAALKNALHGISLASQSSTGGGAHELGKMARKALSDPLRRATSE